MASSRAVLGSQPFSQSPLYDGYVSKHESGSEVGCPYFQLRLTEPRMPLCQSNHSKSVFRTISNVVLPKIEICEI